MKFICMILFLFQIIFGLVVFFGEFPGTKDMMVMRGIFGLTRLAVGHFVDFWRCDCLWSRKFSYAKTTDLHTRRDRCWDHTAFLLQHGS